MYKQTVFGPGVDLINPLLSTAMYCVMFGVIAQLSTDGVPQILFYLAGTALWDFAACINKVSGTFTANSNIFSKVYFPRLAMPLSTMLSGLIQLSCAVCPVFYALLLVYLAKGEVSPSGR